jgi:hypothetical protein
MEKHSGTFMFLSLNAVVDCWRRISLRVVKRSNKMSYIYIYMIGVYIRISVSLTSSLKRKVLDIYILINIFYLN